MELEELQSSLWFAKRCFECFARCTYVNMKKSFLPSNKRPFALTVEPTVAECIARQGLDFICISSVGRRGSSHFWLRELWKRGCGCLLC